MLRLPPDRAFAPALACGTGDVVAVRVGGDASRALVGDIFAEDAPHDLGLFSEDLAFAPDRLCARTELVDVMGVYGHSRIFVMPPR